MATIVLYERNQTIFAGSIKIRHARPLLFLSTIKTRGHGVVGLLYTGRNRAGSNLAVHFDFFSFFFSLSNFSKC